MTTPECPQPIEIRQNILSLANFIDKTSVDIISDPQPEKVGILININRELAAGLFASIEGAEEERPPEPEQPEAVNDPGSFDSSV